jgi:hypothetical protein
LCWKVPDSNGRFQFLSDESTPYYSTDVGSAMQLVEKLADTYGFFLGKHGTPGRPSWCCRFGVEPSVTEGNTAPLVICIAALRALRVSIPE